MTDYLEELLENTEALLDQVRRMDRTGAVQSLDGSAPSHDPARRGTPSGQPEEGQGSPAEPFSPREEEAPASGEPKDQEPAGSPPQGELEPPRRTLTPLEEEGDAPSSPLLDQLERLERAVESGSLSAGRREALGYPQALSKPGGGGLPPDLDAPSGWSGGGGLERPLPLPGGELRWAEQADRAFRRDSRRYDGGFSLY